MYIFIVFIIAKDEMMLKTVIFQLNVFLDLDFGAASKINLGNSNSKFKIKFEQLMK